MMLPFTFEDFNSFGAIRLANKANNSRDNGIVRSEEWASFKLVPASPVQSISKVFRKREALHKEIAEQILMASNPSYAPMKSRWITGPDGNVRRVMVPKKIKKWWLSLPNGKIEVSVYVKRKRLELESGKDAIEIDGKSELVRTFESIQRSIDHGDFDTLI